MDAVVATKGLEETVSEFTEEKERSGGLQKKQEDSSQEEGRRKGKEENDVREMLALPKRRAHLPALTRLLNARVDRSDDQVDRKEDEANEDGDVSRRNRQADPEEPKRRPQSALDGCPNASGLFVLRVELLRRVEKRSVLVRQGGADGGVKGGDDSEGEEDEDEGTFDDAELSHGDGDDESHEGVEGATKGGVETEEGGFVGKGEGDKGGTRWGESVRAEPEGRVEGGRAEEWKGEGDRRKRLRE